MARFTDENTSGFHAWELERLNLAFDDAMSAIERHARKARGDSGPEIALQGDRLAEALEKLFEHGVTGHFGGDSLAVRALASIGFAARIAWIPYEDRPTGSTKQTFIEIE